MTRPIDRAIRRIEGHSCTCGDPDCIGNIGIKLALDILREEASNPKESPCSTCSKYCEGDSNISPYCTLDDKISNDDKIDIGDCCKYNKGYDDLYEKGMPQKVIIKEGANEDAGNHCSD